MRSDSNKPLALAVPCAAPAVRLEMEFAGRTFRGRFLVGDEEWGILGRNILSHRVILCDGPRLEGDARHGSA